MWLVFVKLLGSVVFISGAHLTVRTGDGGHRGLDAEDGGKHRVAGRYTGRRGLYPQHDASPLAPYSDRPAAITYPPSYQTPNGGVMGWGGQIDSSQFSKPSQQYGDSWLQAAVKRLKDMVTGLSSNRVPDQQGVSASWDIQRLPTQQYSSQTGLNGGPNQQGFMGTPPFWKSQQGNWQGGMFGRNHQNSWGGWIAGLDGNPQSWCCGWQGGQLGRYPQRLSSGWVDPRQYNNNWKTMSAGYINPFTPPPHVGKWGVVPTYEHLATADVPDHRGNRPKTTRPFIPPPPGEGEFEPSDSARDLAPEPVFFVK